MAVVWQERWNQVPWWLPGGHAQTIASAFWAQRGDGPTLQWQRERWGTPDGDFLDVDVLDEPAGDNAPLLVLFHGLEGSSASHYAQALAGVARERQWGMAVPHFRGCSGVLNLAPRAYHSGDYQEVDWVLQRMRQRFPGRPLYALGVSLGGNALLRWAGECGHLASHCVRAVVAISAPLDVVASGHAIDRGLNRWLYARTFLQTMRRKAEAKWAQFPGLFDLQAVRRAKTLYAFDQVFTAPLHGFAGVDDYWQRASSKPHLPAVCVPALVLNARNDPFVPADSLPGPTDVGGWVELWQPECGGHVGFPQASRPWGWPFHVRGMPEAVTAWLAALGE